MENSKDINDFSSGDSIVVVGMYDGGDKTKDVNGKFCKIHTFGKYKGQVVVEVSGVKLFCDPDKVVDAGEYWAEKNRENSSPSYVVEDKKLKPVGDDNSGV